MKLKLIDSEDFLPNNIEPLINKFIIQYLKLDMQEKLMDKIIIQIKYFKPKKSMPVAMIYMGKEYWKPKITFYEDKMLNLIKKDMDRGKSKDYTIYRVLFHEVGHFVHRMNNFQRDKHLLETRATTHNMEEEVLVNKMAIAFLTDQDLLF